MFILATLGGHFIGPCRPCQLIRQNKLCLHKKRVQSPQAWFKTPTWRSFDCLGTPIWREERVGGFNVMRKHLTEQAKRMWLLTEEK